MIVICRYLYGYSNIIYLPGSNFVIQSLSPSDDPNNWMQTRAKIYLERNERISKVCQRYRNEYNMGKNFEILNLHTLYHGNGFLLDLKNNIGFCMNGKVGSTTWTNYFYWLLPAKKREMVDDGNDVNMKMRYDVWRHFMVEQSFESFHDANDYLAKCFFEMFQNTKSFNKCSLPDVEEIFNRLVKVLNARIFTFTFVRHPFERLVSDYKNIVLQRTGLIEIGPSRDDNMKFTNQWCSRNHTFPAFVDLVLSKYRQSSCYRSYYRSCNKEKYSFSYHWSPLTSRCSYCEFPYNVIGHMETFDEDIQYIFSKTEINTFFPVKNYTKHLNSSKKKNVVNDNEKETLFYFRQLSQKQFDDLFEMYQMDFDAFGYDAQLYLPQ